MKKISLFGRELTTKTIAALAVISVVAMAFTYATITKTLTITANEPFDPREVVVESTQLYPGESVNVKVHINNKASVTYGIIVNTVLDESSDGNCTLSYSGVEGSISEFNATEGKFNIAPGDGNITYTLSIPADAEAKEYTCIVNSDITRQAEFTSG